MNKQFKMRIKRLLLRQDFIAKKMGISKQYLSMYLGGKREFNSTQIALLNDTLRKFDQ